jgi:hypothetical protein
MSTQVLQELCRTNPASDGLGLDLDLCFQSLYAALNGRLDLPVNHFD